MQNIKCKKSFSQKGEVFFYKDIVYLVLEKKGASIKVSTSVYRTTTTLDTSAEYFNEYFEVVA